MSVSRRSFIKAGILSLAGLGLADAFWFEKFFIEVNAFFIGSATKNTKNIQVIQISDLHLQKVSGKHIRLAKKLNALNPNLIVITGDAIDKAENTSALNDFLRLINKDIKKVAILGNWEYWGKVNLIELKRIYTDHNCTLLVNETLQYTFGNKTLSLTGIDDYLGGNADFDKAMRNYQKSDYHIVLNHCPGYSNSIITPHHVDFVLSGHTHGGQINLFGYIPFLPQGSGNYVKGWYKNQLPHLYVSKGIGTSIFPARFGARAEIAIFNLMA